MSHAKQLLTEGIISMAEYEVIVFAERIGFVSTIDEIRSDKMRPQIEITLNRKRPA